MRGQRKEAIKGYFAKDNAVEELRKRLSEERTLDWLLERAELVTTESKVDEPAAESLTVQVAPEAASEAAADEPAPKKKKATKAKKAAEEPAAE